MSHALDPPLPLLLALSAIVLTLLCSRSLPPNEPPTAEILRQSEMEHYIPNFAFHQIEFGTLPHLTVEGEPSPPVSPSHPRQD